MGMSGLASIVEHTSKLNAEGVVSSFTLPQNVPPIQTNTPTVRYGAPVAPMVGGDPPLVGASAGASAEASAGAYRQLVPHPHAQLMPQMQKGGVIRIPTETEPTKEVVPVQCVVRRGDVELRPGMSHEVMIEVDPDRTSAVRWKFSAMSAPLAFSTVFFRLNHDPNDPMLQDVNVVASKRLATGEGLIEVQERGCLLLRWTNEKASALIFWSSCSRGENSVNCDYEVESVPRNKDTFAASALGLLMLSAGAQ
jgi:hypothetical protein